MRCDCNARFRIYNLLRKLYHSMEKVSSQSLKKRIRNFGKHAPSPRQKYTKKALRAHQKPYRRPSLLQYIQKKHKTAEHMRDTLNGVSRITLFACGEFYCYAVIFGLRRVIFATRVFRRIEYHCEAKPCNITSRQGNITLRVSEEYHF